MVRSPPGRRERESAQHWLRHEVETPEHVVLDYEIAGFGSRFLAALADLAVMAGIALVAGFLILRIGGANPWGSLLATLIWLTLYWGYFTVFEAAFRGQTPGKRWLGIRVVKDNGQPVGPAEAALRNLLRVADYLPPPALLGLGLIAFHPKARRLGDLVAGTMVVRDRPQEAFTVPGPVPAAADAGAPVLGDDAYRVLGEFVERAASLEAASRARLAERLEARFAEHLPAGRAGADGLAALYAAETGRRQGRFGATGAVGAAARFVARKQAGWAQFQQLATEASREGLDRLPPDRLLEFATRYREVAADYARARTYRVPAGTVAGLERAVAAGHNALYREKRDTLRRLWRFVAVDCPAAVVDARAAVLTATAAFLLPALLGFGLLRERPELAPEVLPDVMLERAERGAERQRQGQGYFEAPAGTRPLVAASIIANNVQVAFYCFVGGIFLGVGSLVLLAFNGLSIGATSGHFANAGLVGYLWTFVIGHGVLELFAIWVAGAAGLLLGLAIVAPGRASRRDALAVAGRRAIRLVGFATVLLLVAGLVEGLISASPLAAPGKVAVSVASVLLLAGYLAAGTAAAAADR